MPEDELAGPEDPWLTVAEIAEELRLSPATIRSWISQGTLRARRPGKRKLLVQRSELNRMLAGEDLLDPDAPKPRYVRNMDLVLAPHQSPHWPKETLDHVRRPSWLAASDSFWREALYESDYAPPDPWFVHRVRAVADTAARKAAAFANLQGEDPGEWWYRQSGLPGGALSRELAPGANRPGPDALWTDFDAAVSQLDTAMRAHVMKDEQAALEQVTVAIHDIADALEEAGYPWPETTGGPGFDTVQKQRWAAERAEHGV